MAGQRPSIKEVDDAIWLVSFMHFDLGYIDLEQKSLRSIDNKFGTRLSPFFRYEQNDLLVGGEELGSNLLRIQITYRRPPRAQTWPNDRVRSEDALACPCV